MTGQIFFCAGQSIELKNATHLTDKKTVPLVAWIRVIKKRPQL